MPSKTTFPNPQIYGNDVQSYWSQFQNTQRPVCRVSPTTAEEVSTALGIIRSQGSQFVVKSGGHGTFAGLSNIDGGVVIDLGQMKSFVIGGTAKGKGVTFGPGFRWGEIYSRLEEEGLAILGGRVAHVGVGGLTLGGILPQSQKTPFFDNGYSHTLQVVSPFSGTVMGLSQMVF